MYQTKTNGENTMIYSPILNVHTGEIMEWVDTNGNRYPENPDHIAAQTKEYEEHMKGWPAVDDYGIPLCAEWNAHFE